ncbi:hypothetical protein Tco_1517819, partial [Tanacetum coccineum]
PGKRGVVSLNPNSNTSLIGALKESADTKINSLLDVQIQQEIPHIQSPSILTVPVYVIFEPSILPPIHEIPSVAPATTLLSSSSVSTISHVLQQTKTPIPTPPITTSYKNSRSTPCYHSKSICIRERCQELKEVDHTITLRASLRSEIPSAVNAYLRSSMGDALQKIIEEYVQVNVINEVKNLLPKFLPKAISDFATPVIQSTVKKALEKTSLLLAQSSQAQSCFKAAESLSKYELKTILFKKMDKSRSYLTHDKHQALFDALLNSISLDDDIARGQVDPEKILRKRDRDDEDPLAGPNQGKSPAKTSKSGKSMTAKEPVEEPVFKMASDEIEQTIDDVVNDIDQPPDDTTQTKDKALKKDWF